MSNWLPKPTTLDEFKPEPKKMSTSGDNNWPMFLKKGGKSAVTFLDPDDAEIPVIHFHLLQVDGKLERVACSSPVDRECHFCDYSNAQPDGSDAGWRTAAKKVHCLTVLEDSGNTNEEGTKYPPRKRLRLSHDNDMTRVIELRDMIASGESPLLKDFKSLQFTTVMAIREAKDKSAAIGELKDISGMINLDDFDMQDIAPFTEDEILAQFITDEDTLAHIADQYPIQAPIKVKK